MIGARQRRLWAGFAGLEAFHPRVRIGAVSGRVGHAPGGGCSVGPVAGAGVVGERRLRGVVVVAVAVSPRADETGDAAEDAAQAISGCLFRGRTSMYSSLRTIHGRHAPQKTPARAWRALQPDLRLF